MPCSKPMTTSRTGRPTTLSAEGPPGSRRLQEDRMSTRSTLQTTLEAGQFLLSAELTPPRGWDLSTMLQHVATLKKYVHVAQLNDQLLAQVRCSTLVAA